VALGAGLLATTILLWNENRQLRLEEEARRVANDQPRVQNVEPASPQIAPDELARLKAAESEVMRLRNQVGLLRRELSQRTAGKGQKEAMEVLTPVATNEVVGAFETKLSTSIPEGQTLAFGGWTIGADKRAVAFVYPAVQAGDGTNAQVVIRTTLMEVPPEIWGQLGLADIKIDPQLASQSGLVSQQQAESLIASLTSQTNCLILNRPVIQTSDGAQANLFVGEVTASNQQKGLSLDCLPQLGPDGRTVNLTLGMKFDPPGSAGH
jgi:predicted DNA-binding protein (UPF0251 family)